MLLVKKTRRLKLVGDTHSESFPVRLVNGKQLKRSVAAAGEYFAYDGVYSVAEFLPKFFESQRGVSFAELHTQLHHGPKTLQGLPEA